MNKVNDVTIRFLEFYEYLINIKKVKNSSEFAKTIGISNSMMTEITKRRSNAGIKAIQNTVLSFEYVNALWLLTGSGKMSEFEVPQIKYAKNNDEEWAIKKLGIPLIPVDAIAGLKPESISILDHDIMERYIVPDFTDIDFMIRVKGSSMYPKYNSGDVVACKMINEKSFIQWNKVHVVATKEQGVLIKRLKKGIDNNHLLAISDNKDYDPFNIPKEEVLNIALVKGVIRLE